MKARVVVMIDSRGDDWPEVVQEIKYYLETKGFQNVAEGSADYRDALPDEPSPKKWWVSFERKIE